MSAGRAPVVNVTGRRAGGLPRGIGGRDRQRVGRVGAHADRGDLMLGRRRCGVHGLGAVGARPRDASSTVAGADVVNDSDALSVLFGFGMTVTALTVSGTAAVVDGGRACRRSRAPSSDVHAATEMARTQTRAAIRPRIGRTLGDRSRSQSGRSRRSPFASLTRCPSSEPPWARMTCCRRSRLGGRALIALVRAARGALRLRACRVADVRGHRGVPAGRRVDRRRPQGDVRLRRQGRPAPRAASRGHRVGGAGVRRAPSAHAVEGLVRRPELPLRAAPGGPVPPAPPAGRGGDRHRRPRRRRRGHRPARQRSTGALGLQRAHAPAQLDRGRRVDRPALPRGAARLPRPRAPTCSPSRAKVDDAGQPAAGARLEAASKTRR